jgi:hypothetical protein
MATNTHIPVRSARRCIVRPAVSKFVFATAVAIATSSALAGVGALNASPEVARATRPTGTQAVASKGFGYPIKPFNSEHPIRGNFGDPRMLFHGPPTLRTLLRGSGSFSFHQGVDIAAPNGTAVYPVVDGTVAVVTSEGIRVNSSDGRAFDYWHIRRLVRKGQQVVAQQTVLGHIMKPAGHVHLTEYEDGRVVNPLVPGRLTPYHDSTRPSVRSIVFRRNDTGRELLPSFVRGSVEIVVDAEDMPCMPVHGKWHSLPVTPALITWQIQSVTGRTVVSQRVAVDSRTTVSRNSSFWQVYARGTYQNMAVFGSHYSYMQRGSYLFKLTPHPFETQSLRDGVYELIVTASDIRGNRGSQTLRFTVHNRPGWRG